MYIFWYNLLLILLVLFFSPLLSVWIFSSKKYRNVFKKRLFTRFTPLKCNDEAIRIWIHALSVGEVFIAEPLVKEIAAYGQKVCIVFTVSTQAGYSVAQRNIKPYVNCLSYSPYDIMFSLVRIIDVVAPHKVIFIETDFWPNALFLLKKRGIKTYLVNAKMSRRSYKNFNIFKGFASYFMSLLYRVCVQTPLDKQKFLDIGVNKEKIFLSGNMKFDQKDLTVSKEKLRELKSKLGLGNKRPILVAGSTHNGEEIIIFAAFKKLLKSGISLVLVLAPRNPERASELCSVFTRIEFGLIIKKFSKLVDHGKQNIDVIVVDKIGVLRSLYSISDVTFVGGSMVNEGGHNVVEPALMKKPVLFGPYMDDFADIADMLEKSGGGIRVMTVDDLAAKIALLVLNFAEAERIGHNAYVFTTMYKGALKRTLKLVGLNF